MPCPDIRFYKDSESACDENGNRTVCFRIEHPASFPDPLVNVEIDYLSDGTSVETIGDLSPGAVASPSPCHDYEAGGSYTATITYTYQGQACSSQAPFTLGGCCDVNASQLEGSCQADGTYRAGMYVDNNSIGMGSVTVSSIVWDSTDASSEETISSTDGTIADGAVGFFYHDYDASTARTYTAVVNFAESDCESKEVEIEVPECPQPEEEEECPEVAYSDDEECDEDRNVTFGVTATVRLSGQNIHAHLSLNGAEVDEAESTDSVVLSGSTTVSEGDWVQAVVSYDEPEGCPDDETYLGPAECGEAGGGGRDEDENGGRKNGGDGHPHGHGGSGLGGGSFCAVLCNMWMLLIVALLLAVLLAGAGAADGITNIIDTLRAIAKNPLTLSGIGVGFVVLAALYKSNNCDWCDLARCTLSGVGLAVVTGLLLTVFSSGILLVNWVYFLVAIALVVAATLYMYNKLKCTWEWWWE